jgi:CheY-like chemotaxis protein
MLVHELRTPLHGIQLSLESDPKIEELSELYAHLEEIVEGLQEQSLKAEYKLFSFEGIEQRIRRVIGLSAKNKGIEVSFSWPKIEFNLIGDKSKMTQVLLNFANNAVKYGKQGGKIEIVADIVPAAEPPYYLLKFSVKDNGPGIASEKQQDLFKPFSQVGSVADPKMESSGVGLYLCQRFIEALNSDLEDSSRNVIGVKSQVGVGSEFWFTALAKKEKLQPVAPLSPASPVAKEMFCPGVRVLAADDSTAIQNLMTKALGQRGSASREVVASGKAAVEKFKEGTYNVVLLDENMGSDDIGGSQAAKQICEYAIEKGLARPQIFLITGESQESAQAKLDPSISAHVTVLTKPIDFNAIVKQVNQTFLAPR